MPEAAFIFEDPEGEESRKKRPRLVTSCDACRRRKHKCAWTNPDSGKCDGCAAAKIKCKFDDKERYYAERAAALVRGPAIRNTPSPTSSASTSSSNQSSRANLSVPQPTSWAVESNAVPLFHPLGPAEEGLQAPHPHIISTLVRVFCEQLGHEYPFLSLPTMARLTDGKSSPHLSCAIAALAAPFSHLPGDLYSTAEAYNFHAKRWIDVAIQARRTSPDLIHAIILVSWFEYRSSRLEGFSAYRKLATDTAVQMGFSNDGLIICMARNKDEESMMHATWAGVTRLNTVGSYGQPSMFA